MRYDCTWPTAAIVQPGDDEMKKGLAFEGRFFSSLARPERLSPRSATDDAVRAVADALCRRESATSYRADAR
jgi:hypothetical protein